MAQKKGQTGNPNGRKKGSQNKGTKEVRDLLESNRIELVKRAIDLVLCKDLSNTNVTILNKLLDKLIPSLQNIDFKGSVEHKNLEQMTDEELEQVIRGS